MSAQISESIILQEMLVFLYVSGKSVWFFPSIMCSAPSDDIAASLSDSLSVSLFLGRLLSPALLWNHRSVLLIGHHKENGKQFLSYANR